MKYTADYHKRVVRWGIGKGNFLKQERPNYVVVMDKTDRDCGYIRASVLRQGKNYKVTLFQGYAHKDTVLLCVRWSEVCGVIHNHLQEVDRYLERPLTTFRMPAEDKCFGPILKYKAGDVVVCTHQYCEHYGELGIVVSSSWAGVGDREYVTVQFDYSENCGSSRSFFGNDHPGSLEVIDSMPDLVGLTPVQIHEVLINEAPKFVEIRLGDKVESDITGSPVVTKGTLTYKGYVFELSVDAWGPMLTMKCGTCGKGEVKRLDTIFPELRGAS